MNDERMVEYLRARGHATPPATLVSSLLDAVADTPQQRHSRFMTVMPGLATVGVAAAVLIGAVLIGQRPVAGPDESTAATRWASPSHAPSPEGALPELLQAGDSVTVDAHDATGVWGSITITRQPGGGEDDRSDGWLFVLLEIRYDAERMPRPARFGSRDWTVALASDGSAVARPDRILTTSGSLDDYPDQYGVDRDIVADPIGGLVGIGIEGDASNSDLDLVYQPEGFDRPIEVIAIQRSQARPTSGDPTAPPSPPAARYVDRDGLPFSVIESSEADALFTDPDTCTSTAGYTVSYPDSWYTNTDIGDIPACTWFSPVSYEVDDPSRVPDEIAIIVHVFEGGIGQIPEYPRTLHEVVSFGGLDGSRSEDTIPSDPPDYAYTYAAWLDADYLGRKLSGSTSTMNGGDYELNRAVLDRIMASLALADGEAFSPAPHPEADALFSDTTACTSPQGGYTVDIPASWYSNVAGAPAAADPDAQCTRFAPEPFDEGVLPAIVGQRFEGDHGSFEAVIEREFHTIAGRPAVRVEYRGAAGEGGMQPPEWRQLVWLIQFGEIEETGPNLVFTTSTDDGRDYQLNKAVLDRMIGSLGLLGEGE
jgi:hypothetical protein